MTTKGNRSVSTKGREGINDISTVSVSCIYIRSSINTVSAFRNETIIPVKSDSIVAYLGYVENRSVFYKPNLWYKENRTVFCKPNLWYKENRSVFCKPNLWYEENRSVFYKPNLWYEENRSDSYVAKVSYDRIRLNEIIINKK